MAFGGALEMALCAKAWGYRWEEWEDLDPYYKAFCLAVYRCELQIEAILATPDYR